MSRIDLIDQQGRRKNGIPFIRLPVVGEWLSFGGGNWGRVVDVAHGWQGAEPMALVRVDTQQRPTAHELAFSSGDAVELL